MMNIFSLFKKKNRRQTNPQLQEEYYQYFQKKPKKTCPIRAIQFVVLDTETTGLDYKKDKLLSLASLPVQNNQMDIPNLFEAFFKQHHYQPNQQVVIHGILNKHLAEGLEEKEILSNFLGHLKNKIIVGHHIRFDVAMLNHALKYHYGFKLKNKTLDTATLANRVIGKPLSGFTPLPLDVLCKEYNIPLGNRHTAAGDTFITAILFLKLLWRLEKRGVKTYGDLMR